MGFDAAYGIMHAFRPLQTTTPAMQNDKKTIPWSEAGAVIYLTFPVFLFFALYLRLLVAVPACAFMLLCAFQLVKRVNWCAPRAEWTTNTAIATICIAWLWISGGWGDLRQNGDWVKHYAIINYLASQPAFTLIDVKATTPEFLRYSIGWYIIPALAVKAFAGHFQALVSALWTLLGLGLFFTNLTTLVRGRSAALVAIGVFIFFSGADIIGYAITHLQPGPRFHLEWWSGWAEYASNTTSIFWVPQHALPAWLGIVILIRQMDRPTMLPYIALIFSVSLLWSPFAVIGLAPFAVALVLRHSIRSVVLDWRPIAAVILITVPIAIYLRAGADGVPHAFIWNDGCLGRSICFTWSGYVRFLLIEIGLPVILLLFAQTERTSFMWISIASLLVFPLIHIGAFNDFTMRSSIPALAVLAIGLGRVASSNQGAIRIGAACCLILGLATPLGEMARPFVAEKIEPGPVVHASQEDTFEDLSIGWSALRYQYFSRTPLKILRGE